MTDAAHWDAVYQKKHATEVSWYQAHLQQSLSMIASCDLPGAASIVDVGGGASTLVDDLLVRRYSNVTVIDLSAKALGETWARLGERATNAHLVCGDATTPLLDSASVDLWHDRAVFHFLTDDSRRAAYVEQVTRCVRPGGQALIATFALDGPERCSGLPVRRYSPQAIAEALGPSFELIAEANEDHLTPGGNHQSFAYALCRRRDAHP